MPEHTSFLSYVVEYISKNWAHNFECHAKDTKECLWWQKTLLGQAVGGSVERVNHQALEPLFASMTIVLVVLLFALIVRSQIKQLDKAVVPDDRFSIRTIIEYLIELFYKTMKEMMGAKRAKRYLPLIGTCACFIFFSNIFSLIPGFTPPTSSLSITFGCSLFVFVMYNYYGFKENGLSYAKHFTGPVWWLAWLIGPIEIISNLIRPITLAIRLMLNMAVDHLVLGIVIGLLPLLVPLPLMVLGTLVALVQTFVFCLLSSIYVSMATEHEH